MTPEPLDSFAATPTVGSRTASPLLPESYSWSSSSAGANGDPRPHAYPRSLLVFTALFREHLLDFAYAAHKVADLRRDIHSKAHPR